MLPYLNDGILAWGNPNKTSLNILYKLQKRAVRYITQANFRAPGKPLFQELNMLYTLII